MNSIMEVLPQTARSTVRKLMAIHHQTLDDMDKGKRFWKDGKDITQALRHNVMIELGQCAIAIDGLDALRAGDVKRAANLLNHIQERPLDGR